MAFGAESRWPSQGSKTPQGEGASRLSPNSGSGRFKLETGSRWTECAPSDCLQPGQPLQLPVFFPGEEWDSGGGSWTFRKASVLLYSWVSSGLNKPSKLMVLALGELGDVFLLHFNPLLNFSWGTSAGWKRA